MRRWAAAALVCAAALGVYLSNGRAIGAGDTLPARYLPWSVLQSGSFALDAFPVLYDDAARRTFPLLDGVPYFLHLVGGRYVSAYPPGPAVVALPVYAPAILAAAPPSPEWAARLEKLAASVITALSVAVLFCALDEVVSRRWAVVIAAVYAFGTSSLSVSSQALWQHGPSQLFISLMLLCVVRGLRDERWLAATGFAMAAAVAMRATDALLVLPLAAWIAWSRPALIPRLALLGAPPIAALIAYNWMVLGSLTGEAGKTSVPPLALFSQIPLSEGLAGLLMTPGRGLFVYSPVLLLSIVGGILVWRRGPAAFRALSLGPPLVVLLVGKWFLWWGGHSWGPRLLADTTPVLCFLLYPLVGTPAPRRLAKSALVLLGLVSAGAHALGAFAYDGRWDGLTDPDGYYARLWSWRQSPLAFYGGELLRRLPLPSSPPALATSANAPSDLSASLSSTPVPQDVLAGERLPVLVAAKNLGRALWLASAAGDRGAVKLGWRWVGPGSEEPEGRAPLPADVAPGYSVEIAAHIAAPSKPGDYELVVDLVSERVTWFGERGTKPISRVVSVRPFDIDRFLTSPTSDALAPKASIATDRGTYRRGEAQELVVSLESLDRPRTFDAYLVLRRTDGATFAYDGRQVTPAGQWPWRPWVKDLPLPARANGRFRVSLDALPPGAYRWYVVLTTPGTHRPVVTASGDFSLS